TLTDCGQILTFQPNSHENELLFQIPRSHLPFLSWCASKRGCPGRARGSAGRDGRGDLHRSWSRGTSAASRGISAAGCYRKYRTKFGGRLISRPGSRNVATDAEH